MKGIDVSECCYLINYDPPKGQGNWCGAIHKGACKVYSKDCKYNENCYYKQLKRLEQENADLKAENDKLKEEVRTEKIYSSQIEELEESLNYLKQENEQLKEEIEELKDTLIFEPTERLPDESDEDLRERIKYKWLGRCNNENN